MWHYPIFAYAELIQFIEGVDIKKNILSVLIFVFNFFYFDFKLFYN